MLVHWDVDVLVFLLQKDAIVNLNVVIQLNSI